jgi:uncharacterized protein (DUF3820 family)
MLEFDDETPMPFGKHKGTPLGQVPASYLSWLEAELEPDSPVRGALLHYIHENAAAIEMELQQDRDSHRSHGRAKQPWRP